MLRAFQTTFFVASTYHLALVFELPLGGGSLALHSPIAAAVRLLGYGLDLSDHIPYLLDGFEYKLIKL